MQIQICDYCGEKRPRHHIVLSRRPNDDPVTVEICGVCLSDIQKYIDDLKAS